MIGGPWEGRNVVYRAYRADGALLYIGCTSRMRQRWAEHRGGRSNPQAVWFADAARWVIRIFPDSDSAHIAEAKAIESELPIHNKYRGRRLWLLNDDPAGVA
jgi:predicted GIY-YIG superfamily endonuclease